MAKVNRSGIKATNRKLILNTIRQNKALTIEELIQYTGLSRPTVADTVQALLDKRIISKSGFVPSDIGRQPCLYSLSEDEYYAIGIDFEFPPVRIAISNLAGQEVYHDCWDLPASFDIYGVADSIVEHINAAIDNNKIKRAKIIGLGLGIPTIGQDDRKISRARIKGWNSIDIGDYIEQKTSLPVSVQNDTRLLGLLVRRNLSFQRESFLYCLHRTGIGVAIFNQGKIYTGKYGNAGQFGHMTIKIDGEECYCGRRGCIERYCSQSAIVNAFCDLKGGGDYTIEEVFRLGDEGDRDALHILQEAGNILGIGLANVMRLLDINKVVLGGMQWKEDNIFLRSIYESIRENTVHFLLEKPILLLDSIPPSSYGMGGCDYILEDFFSRPI